MFAIPLLAGVVALVFSATVLRQHASRHRPHQLAWGAALSMFGLAAIFEAAGVGVGWSGGIYKGYYLFGALLNVGWLGVGTIYLLAPRRVGDGAAVVMGVYSVVALVAVVEAGIHAEALVTTFPTRASTVPLVLPLLSNIAGTLVLVGGAAWSALLALRRRAPAIRVVGTALIAAGALIVGADHSVAQATGAVILQPLSELAGIVVMFAGYLAVESRRGAQASARTTSV